MYVRVYLLQLIVQLVLVTVTTLHCCLYTRHHNVPGYKVPFNYMYIYELSLFLGTKRISNTYVHTYTESSMCTLLRQPHTSRCLSVASKRDRLYDCYSKVVQYHSQYLYTIKADRLRKLLLPAVLLVPLYHLRGGNRPTQQFLDRYMLNSFLMI